MPTTLEHLQEAKDAAAQKLRAAMSNPAFAGYNPNAMAAPNLIDHQGYVKTLLETIKALDEAIAEEIVLQDGAFEVTSEMMSA
jgi:hypothetical protein